MEASLLSYTAQENTQNLPRDIHTSGTETDQVWYDAQENDDDDQLRLAIAISKEEMSESQRREQEEDEELRRILELSLLEK